MFCHASVWPACPVPHWARNRLTAGQEAQPGIACLQATDELFRVAGSVFCRRTNLLGGTFMICKEIRSVFFCHFSQSWLRGLVSQLHHLFQSDHTRTIHSSLCAHVLFKGEAGLQVNSSPCFSPGLIGVSHLMPGSLLPPEWPFVRLWSKAYRCGLPAGLPPRNESPASWSFGKGNVASESVKTCKALSLSGNRVKSDFPLRIANSFLLFTSDYFRSVHSKALKGLECLRKTAEAEPKTLSVPLNQKLNDLETHRSWSPVPCSFILRAS
jgi:hypothetical protein